MEEKKEVNLSAEEYARTIPSILRRYLMAQSVYRSVNRAMRRNHVSVQGYMVPKRPFNNKANSTKRKGKFSRRENEEKKMLYGQIKYRGL